MDAILKDLEELTLPLIHNAGFENFRIQIEDIGQGGNNQLFLIRHPKQNFVLKKYFYSEIDGRDRLSAEFNFLEAIYKIVPTRVPKPFAKNIDANIGLYSFLEGKRLASSDEIKNAYINDAAQFIANINKNKSVFENIIKNGSEAYFSIQSHLNAIDLRVLELSSAPIKDKLFQTTVAALKIRWEETKNTVLESCLSQRLDIDQDLELAEKILSPSDFGFHNALVSSDDQVCFIDFEYAGWDDPAKLVGDFFSQVAVPISSEFLQSFMNTAFESLINPEAAKRRAEILLNPYKIKWVCIILNVFLKNNLERRLFANPSLNITQLKELQLRKATKLLSGI